MKISTTLVLATCFWCGTGCVVSATNEGGTPAEQIPRRDGRLTLDAGTTVDAGEDAPLSDGGAVEGIEDDGGELDGGRDDAGVPPVEPEFVQQTIEAENYISIDENGQVVDQWSIEDGLLDIGPPGGGRFLFTSPVAGLYRIRIMANGEEAEAKGPLVEIRVNGVAVQGFEVAAGEPRPFAFALSLEEGVAQIDIVFVDDLFVSTSEDRNLLLGPTTISGPHADLSLDAGQGPDDQDAGTFDDAGAPLADAGGDAGSEGGNDAGQGLVSVEVPPGRVPVAVGIANGRIATSCDRGQTWNNFIVDANATDHSAAAAHTDPVFGNGVMVVAFGWGAAGQVFRSEVAGVWERVEGSQIHWVDGSTHEFESSLASLFFDGHEFNIIAGRRVFRSLDGRVWYEQSIAIDYLRFQMRQNSFSQEHSRYFLRGEDVTKTIQWFVRSDDSAETLIDITEEDGFDFDCGGRLNPGHGVLVSNGDKLCISSDGGESWRHVTPPESFAAVLPTESGWIGFKRYKRSIYSSPVDLSSFAEGPSMPDFVISAAGRSHHGYYVAASQQNAEFYSSENGSDWTAAEGDVIGGTMRLFGFGDLAPSLACPLQ